MRIGLTGTHGFLGSWLMAELPKQGHTPVALVRSFPESDNQISINLAASDDQLVQDLTNAKLDCLILAGAADTRGASPGETRLLIEGNVLLPGRLLSAAHAAGLPHCILVGSSWQEVQGEGFAPWDLYAASKEALFCLAAAYENLGMAITRVHLFDTYGPGDSRPKLLNLMLRAAVSGESIGLSPGQQQMHLVHVKDVSRALQQLAERPGPIGATYRIDSDEAVTVDRLATLVKGLEPHFRFELGARPYRRGEIMTPRSRHPRPPGWEPQVPLSAGLAECLAAERERQSHA